MPIGKISGLNALNALRRTQNEQNNTMQQMATGNRLYQAANGPSDVAIASAMQAQTSAINQAFQNAQDTGNLIQTADAAMGNIESALMENRDLAVRASNTATMTTQDQARIDQQYQANVAEVDRGANAATFNTKQLLDGTYGTQAAQVGPNAGPENQIAVTLNDTGAAALGVAGTGTATGAQAQTAISAADTALGNVNNQRAEAGVTQRRLESAGNELMNQGINLAAATSRITDVNYAQAASNQKTQGYKSQIALWAAKRGNQLGAMSNAFA